MAGKHACTAQPPQFVINYAGHNCQVSMSTAKVGYSSSTDRLCQEIKAAHQVFLIAFVLACQAPTSRCVYCVISVARRFSHCPGCMWTCMCTLEQKGGGGGVVHWGLDSLNEGGDLKEGVQKIALGAVLQQPPGSPTGHTCHIGRLQPPL